MSELKNIVTSWASAARAKIASDSDTVTDEDIAALLTAIADAQPSEQVAPHGTAPTSQRGQLRQRLLYLIATSPFIGSELVSAAVHEPVPGKCAQIDPTQPDLPYQCVHDALCDGWLLLSLPEVSPEPKGDDSRSVGYQFVLQKLEIFDDA